MFFQRQSLNGKQLAQKNSDAQLDYFAVRFAIKSGDKQAAQQVESYAKRYSGIARENIEALQALLVK